MDRIVAALLLVGLGVLAAGCLAYPDTEVYYEGVSADVVFPGVPMDRQAIYDFVTGSANLTVTHVYAYRDSRPFHYMELCIAGFDPQANDYAFSVYMHPDMSYPDLTVHLRYEGSSRVVADSQEQAERASEACFARDRAVFENLTARLVDAFRPFAGRDPAPFELVRVLESPDL